MALLKKIHPEWSPSENRGLQVGETVDIGDYITLVRSGMAVLVDETGRELPLPGTVFTCPICYAELTTIEAFTAHIEVTHNPKPVVDTPRDTVAKTEPVVVEKTTEVVEDKKKAFAERMKKAREEAKAKKEVEVK
jgi:hypothetical protein